MKDKNIHRTKKEKENLSLLYKNKTYEEIYGKDKAELEKRKRTHDAPNHSKMGIQKLSENRKNKNYEELFGESLSKQIREKHSNFMKEKWKDPKYAKLVIKNAIKGLIKRPTSYEKKISELCIENNLPFIYTGDGTFLIGYKNPDFINEKQKIAVEVYYSYFKIRDFDSCENYEKQRSEYFAKYGYRTIFIRTEEINDKNWKEVCLRKLI